MDRKRNTSTIPFGYKLHETDPKILVEDENQKQVVNEIRELASQFSLRKLAQYAEIKTGRKITPRGMRKIIERGY